MTSPQETQDQPTQEAQPSNKELNFRALEAKYQRKLEEVERKAQEAEKRAQEALAKRSQSEEDSDDDGEPYVDSKRLHRTLSSFERKLEDKIDKRAEEKARHLVTETRRQDWLKNNPDFYEVLQNADKFAEREPELAETILQMPDGFERQKLVYKTIKSMGLHKPEQKAPSVQEKIDANKRSPYYQPTGVGTAPYAPTGDYSPAGQKNAYQKMQELKSKLRI